MSGNFKVTTWFSSILTSPLSTQFQAEPVCMYNFTFAFPLEILTFAYKAFSPVRSLISDVCKLNLPLLKLKVVVKLEPLIAFSDVVVTSVVSFSL